MQVSILQSCVADKFSGRVAQCNDQNDSRQILNANVTKCISDPKYSQNINEAKLGIADQVLEFIKGTVKCSIMTHKLLINLILMQRTITINSVSPCFIVPYSD